MLKFNLVPSDSCNYFQNLEVKRGSQLEIINTGTPWSLTISRIYNSTIFKSGQLVLTTKKWANFVSQFTTTQIAFLLFGDVSKPTTKPMTIHSHFHSRIEIGWSNPVGTWCSTFTHLQVRHLATYSIISFFIPFWNKDRLKQSMVHFHTTRVNRKRNFLSLTKNHSF